VLVLADRASAEAGQVGRRPLATSSRSPVTCGPPRTATVNTRPSSPTDFAGAPVCTVMPSRRNTFVISSLASGSSCGNI
jgi:hypothetical protein